MSESCVKKKGWGNGDEGNILVLLFLYVLQGIPLGLAGAIPFILTQRKASYGEQAGFSFSIWPFSLKLLWAPIVDSLFIPRFASSEDLVDPHSISHRFHPHLVELHRPKLFGQRPRFNPHVFLAQFPGRHSGHRRRRMGPHHVEARKRRLRLHLQLRGTNGGLFPSATSAISDWKAPGGSPCPDSCSFGDSSSLSPPASSDS